MCIDIDLILSAIGALTGVIALAVSIFGLNLSERKRNYSVAVHEFLSAMESPEFTKARSAVINSILDEENIDLIVCDNADFSYVVNFFHHWGILAEQGYLPLWVFKYGSGNGTHRLYKKVLPYIKKMREKQVDLTYAKGFDKLIDLLKSERIIFDDSSET